MIRILLVSSCLALATAGHALAGGTLAGTVRDDSGLPLPGAIVQAEGAAGSASSASDPSGAYTLAGLPAGSYRVSFRLPSFATTVRTVALQDGAESHVDVVLRVALLSEVLVSSTRSFRNLAELSEAEGGVLGVASAGSEGVVSARQIEARPVYRTGEVYESVPGVLVSQHSGEGKANQYYVRGFNIDHGTDLATSVAGVPVNMPTHGHGQGYSDNNFLIPELVSGVQYQKGTYSAEQGDFSAAGAIGVSYLNVLDQPVAKLEAGQNAFGRALFARSSPVGGGRLLYAFEAHHSDGPWVRPDDYRKLNGVLRYSRGNQQNGLSLTAMGYSGRWHSTDQVPRRAVLQGAIDRFGAIDPSDRGATHRLSLSGEWRRTSALGLTQVKAYALDYGLDLYSNFTYFLDDPVNGDQFEQKDQRRVYGAAVTQRFLSRFFGRDTESALGFQGRLDDIPTVGLYHTRERQRLETVRQDDVRQASGALFFQTSVQWTPVLRTILGLRADAYDFDVKSSLAANSGTRGASIVSPKLSVVLGPWRGTELYANWGLGYHSNDARGAVQTVDPRSGEAVLPVDPLVRARGAELGVRSVAFGKYQGTVAFWGLDLESELLFVGDAGTTEASRPSRRLGVEWSNVVSPRPWLSLDADLAYARARFRDDGPAGQHIPGTVQGVVSAGVSVHELGRFSGSLRLRYIGPRPLIEDDSVRSEAATTLNLRAAWRAGARHTLSLEVFNLTNTRVSDIDYFYTSRLPGEPLAGVDDVHTHPLEPRSVRLSLTARF